MIGQFPPPPNSRGDGAWGWATKRHVMQKKRLYRVMERDLLSGVELWTLSKNRFCRIQ